MGSAGMSSSSPARRSECASSERRAAVHPNFCAWCCVAAANRYRVLGAMTAPASPIVAGRRAPACSRVAASRSYSSRMPATFTV